MSSLCTVDCNPFLLVTLLLTAFTTWFGIFKVEFIYAYLFICDTFLYLSHMICSYLCIIRHIFQFQVFSIWFIASSFYHFEWITIRLVQNSDFIRNTLMVILSVLQCFFIHLWNKTWWGPDGNQCRVILIFILRRLFIL